MSQKQTLIRGTAILTLTSFCTRFIGFFYRIFLSHTFGEENVGLYQLVFPVYALGFSLSCAGVQLALSRCVARHTACGEVDKAKELLKTSLLFTFTLSCIIAVFLQHHSATISTVLLHDARCTSLLILLSYAFPFASIHSCICGYSIGLKGTKIPAVSQLIEQTFRVLFVFLVYLYADKQGISVSIVLAVAGLAAGEIFASLYSLMAIYGITFRIPSPALSVHSFLIHFQELFKHALPLTTSRVLLNILQSAEAVSIPLCLQYYGLSVSESLKIYGVLTGMALPCILFPSAITNAVSSMLLPTVAEMQAAQHQKNLRSVIVRVTCYCIFLGSAFGVLLLLSGKWLGIFLFHSELAGQFILTLSWICPFLYTNTVLLSMVNGLGKTFFSFFANFISLCIRIAGVFLFIPQFGILGYLIGLLVSQIVLFSLCLLRLNFYLHT